MATVIKEIHCRQPCYGEVFFKQQNEAGVEQAIIGFHQDDEQHWVAELACGHFQHVRHEPPWQLRPWVVSETGRASMLGECLNCKKCVEGAPPDVLA